MIGRKQTLIKINFASRAFNKETREHLKFMNIYIYTEL